MISWAVAAIVWASPAIAQTTSAEWIVAPAPSLASKAPWKDVIFSVDGRGRPWIAHDRKDFICPVEKAEFQFVAGIDGLANVGNSSPLLSLHGYLGTIPILEMVKNDPRGRPVLPFKAIRRLPRPGCRLAPGAEGILYALCDDGGVSELYLLRPGAAHRFELLLKGKGLIEAAAGDGDANFAAVGPVVYRLGPAPSPVFRHPTSNIRELSYDPTLGLFYATELEVGRWRPEGLERLLSRNRPHIRIRRGALYVFSEADWGIARLTGF